MQKPRFALGESAAPGGPADTRRARAGRGGRAGQPGREGDFTSAIELFLPAADRREAA